jgi:hypothetical protein
MNWQIGDKARLSPVIHDGEPEAFVTPLLNGESVRLPAQDIPNNISVVIVELDGPKATVRITKPGLTGAYGIVKLIQLHPLVV